MSFPTFYDTHAHLARAEFRNELAAVIDRAQAAGIEKIVSIATDFESSRACIEIAERFPNVFASVGWHPSDAPRAPEDIRPGLLELVSHPKVVAIGETGLDYYRLPSRMQGADAAADAEYKRKQVGLF